VGLLALCQQSVRPDRVPCDRVLVGALGLLRRIVLLTGDHCVVVGNRITDALACSKSGVLVGGAKRLYGIVEGGDLGYVEERGYLEERVDTHGGWSHICRRGLSRFAG
jgi:hypothetical protein